ncbi:unnamed protein product [marine sediment metagenome]|uniref:Uncharacterized protein n=1 Tax=marine sediment metagenome TaxID=412755 RepID=X1S7I6_9ZZZZ
MDKGFTREVEMKGLTLGVELGPERVSREICPDCPFKTSFCEFRMKLWLDNPDLACACKGMRAWVTIRIPIRIPQFNFRIVHLLTLAGLAAPQLGLWLLPFPAFVKSPTNYFLGGFNLVWLSGYLNST